ncbi:MAG: hypothetical protein ABMB14_31955, partial [Myxococcota bacterium]
VRAIELSEQLGWTDPSHLGWRRGLASAWLRHGDVARAQGRAADASAAWHRALEAAHGLADLQTYESSRRAREVVHALEARGFSDRELGVLRSRWSRAPAPASHR